MVVAEEEHAAYRSELESNGADIYILNREDPVRHCAEIVARHRADILHLNIWRNYAYYRDLTKELHIPVGISYHAAPNHRHGKYFTLLSGLRNGWASYAHLLDRFKHFTFHMACCETMSNYLMSLAPKSVKKKIFAIPNAVPLRGHVRVRSINAGPIRFLQVGGLEERKQPLASLRAFRQLQKEIKDVRLTFLGTGSLYTRLRDEVATNGDTNVDIAGATKDVATYYQTHDVLLLPSTAEGLPYALLEAGSYAMPAIASDVGGVHECVRDGRTGYLLKWTNRHTICNAMRKFAMNEKRCVEMGHEMQKLITQQHGMDLFGDRLANMYESMS